MHGKSDSIDAIEAARTVLSSRGTSEAKDSDTPAESLRCLLAARTQLIRSITALSNCIMALLTPAPEEVRARYRELPTPALIESLALPSRRSNRQPPHRRPECHEAASPDL